jgi:sugar phosphate isomerase/epimerase
MQLTLGSTTRPWNQWSFEEACKAIAQCGYTDVAPFYHNGAAPLNSESTPADIAAARKVCDDHGLEPSMLITGTRLELPTDEAVADYCKVIDVAAAAGVEWVMNCGCGNPDQYEAYNELFRQCAPYAAEKSAKLVMKPHGGNGLTGKLMKDVVEAVGHPNFSICYDPGNILYYTKGEQRPEPDVHDIKEHVGICIIKDCVVERSAFEDDKPEVQVLPGEGLVDFARVLGSLVDAGFRGPLYVECVGGSEWDDINDRAKRTHEFVIGIVEKLG